MPCEPLKHPFIDLNQVAFRDGQEAENELKVSRDPLKYRFLEFSQVAFRVGKRKKMSSQCLATT